MPPFEKVKLESFQLVHISNSEYQAFLEFQAEKARIVESVKFLKMNEQRLKKTINEYTEALRETQSEIIFLTHTFNLN